MKTNKIRQIAGIYYFFIGGLLLVIWIWLCGGNMRDAGVLTWALAWAAFGIGVGLINTRTLNNGKRDRQWKHYLFLFYPLAWAIVFLASMLIAFNLSHSSFNQPNTEWSFWVILIALVLGLFAENLGRIAKMIINK